METFIAQLGNCKHWLYDDIKKLIFRCDEIVFFLKDSSSFRDT